MFTIYIVICTDVFVQQLTFKRSGAVKRAWIVLENHARKSTGTSILVRYNSYYKRLL